MIIGVAVDKQIANFRGTEEFFTNVWHYDTDIEVTADQLADAVVALERNQFFTSAVNFRRVRAWGPADQGKVLSEMLVDKPLTGTGALVFTSGNSPVPMYPELAVVINWPTGRKDSRGNPIFLRKYLHTMQTAPVDAARAQAEIAAAVRAQYLAAANNAKNLTGLAGQGASICDKNGNGIPLNTTPEVLPYLHVRELKR